MIKTLLLLCLAVIVVVLAVAATRPPEFRIDRSVAIQAPVEKLFPMISDLKAFNLWNPYARKDAAMKLTFGGPESGPGAYYDFLGNKDVGKGRITLLKAQPNSEVTMQLDMVEPFEGHNQIVFALVPEGSGARVSWTMQGPNSFIGKLMGLFFNMDQMIGKDFEAGLSNLKELAERS